MISDEQVAENEENNNNFKLTYNFNENTWKQPVEEIENWNDKQKLLNLMKKFQPQLYKDRFNMAFDRKDFLSKEELKNSLNIDYCKKFSTTIDGDNFCTNWNTNWNKNLLIYYGNITQVNAIKIDNLLFSFVNIANETLLQGEEMNKIYEARYKNKIENSLRNRNEWIYYSGKKESNLENLSLEDCQPGEIIVTNSFGLKSDNNTDFIIHTIVPEESEEEKRKILLTKCYENALQYHFEKSLENKVKNSFIVFPCISSSEAFFPLIEACHIACSTLRDFIINNQEKYFKHFDDWKIILCNFSVTEQAIYENLMDLYFP
ncbi:hypothetical protein ABK040_011852 [Willaertia magna]